MAHFVAFFISFQKIIPSKIPPGGGGEQGLLVAQGLYLHMVAAGELCCLSDNSGCFSKVCFSLSLVYEWGGVGGLQPYVRNQN